MVSCTVQIVFNATASGTYPGTITVSDQNSTYSQALPQTTLVYYPMLNAPSSLAFGFQAVGTTSAAQMFSITNGNVGGALGHPISVSAPRTANFTFPAGRTCPVSPQICTLSVAFSPQMAGAIAESVIVTDMTSGFTATMGLSGTGASPAVSLSSSSVTFPARADGTTSVPMNVTVTNTGNAPLTINMVNVLGAVNGNFSQSNNCSTVTANATCTIGVTFAPTAPGVQTASIQIVSNAASSPNTIMLSGTGM